MTDFNFRKPTSGEEVLRAAPRGTKLYLYSDLANDPRDAETVLRSLGRNSLILYQDPDRMNSGHWVSLSFHPKRKEVYFFSSYGGMPDREKISWVNPYKLFLSGQIRNVINDGLKSLAEKGWTIHFNDFPFQHVGDGSATCGIWSTAFLNSGLNPDEFAENHRSVEYYFRKYF